MSLKTTIAALKNRFTGDDAKNALSLGGTPAAEWAKKSDVQGFITASGGGNVVGPLSSALDHLALFTDSTGKSLKDGGAISVDADAESIVSRDNAGNITANKYTSSVPTGTPPIEVASTTKVNDLNADMLDGHHASVVAEAGAIPVYDPNGKLVGDITGNAPTSTKSVITGLGGMFEAFETGTFALSAQTYIMGQSYSGSISVTVMSPFSGYEQAIVFVRQIGESKWGVLRMRSATQFYFEDTFAIAGTYHYMYVIMGPKA